MSLRFLAENNYSAFSYGMDQNLIYTKFLYIFFGNDLFDSSSDFFRALIHSLSVEPTSGPEMDSLEASALYDLADHMVLQ